MQYLYFKIIFGNYLNYSQISLKILKYAFYGAEIKEVHLHPDIMIDCLQAIQILILCINQILMMHHRNISHIQKSSRKHLLLQKQQHLQNHFCLQFHQILRNHQTFCHHLISIRKQWFFRIKLLHKNVSF